MHQGKSEPEVRWLGVVKSAGDRVFVGLDHHSRQVTVAAFMGREVLDSPGAAPASRMPVAVFDQDGLGYPLLIEWLEARFPGVGREKFTFIAEPTFARPLSNFLALAGFPANEIRWVRTQQVSRYRKAKVIGKAGKNDMDDARAMAMMAFEAVASPFGDIGGFLPGVRQSARAEGLGRLAADYWALSERSVRLRNQIWDLVLRLFPECWRLWSRAETVIKPDGSRFEMRKMALFDSRVPTEILQAFPGAQAIREAGFDQIWATVGRRGIRRETIRKAVELAERSAGTGDQLDSERLRLLIGEYQGVLDQADAYRQSLEQAIAADPVLHSLRAVTGLGPQILGTIVGALGDVGRFPDVDAVKRYLNLAPVPMPQTGTVDPLGRPVQIWRFPANSYEKRGSRRRLVYQIPGRQDVRRALYWWFTLLVRNVHRTPDDPFVRLYMRLKDQHQGKARWFGKVRWKAAGKLVTVIFHCLRTQEAYDPDRLLEDMPSG